MANEFRPAGFAESSHASAFFWQELGEQYHDDALCARLAADWMALRRRARREIARPGRESVRSRAGRAARTRR